MFSEEIIIIIEIRIWKTTDRNINRFFGRQLRCRQLPRAIQKTVLSKKKYYKLWKYIPT